MVCQDCDCQQPRDTEQYYNFRQEVYRSSLLTLEAYLSQQKALTRLHPNAIKFVADRIKYLKMTQLLLGEPQ